MFKRIDLDEDIKGFSYMNKTGGIEAVQLGATYVSFRYEDTGAFVNDMYYEDIPNFIKALQAAYACKKGQS